MVRAPKHVLVAPLDWGLGHASRCIPVIRELMARGCRVSVAGSGDSLALLKAEFSAQRFHSIPGYTPAYPKGRGMVWAMCRQLPRFMSVVRAEHLAVERIVAAENIDIVISDNRYGCWSASAHSVFMTHQRNVLMPPRFRWLGKIVRMTQERLVQNFQECWIPDLPEPGSLAGQLVALDRFPPVIPTTFVGRLSRFEQREHTEKKYDVVVLLSGPEPQRSTLERILVAQLEKTSLSYRVIRGLPSGSAVSPAPQNSVDFLSGIPLQQCLQSASIVIARSGYSSIMDLEAIAARPLFVPTPGQTEQEYLAARLRDQRIAFFMEQDRFDLSTGLAESKKFTGFAGAPPRDLLKQRLDSFTGYAEMKAPD